MTNDLPIHLHAQSVETPVTLFQSQLDGLCALIHFCEGMEKSGQGRLPGSFELIMHYRELRSRVLALQNKEVK